MPVSDEDLKIIASFENLQSLNLNFSDVTGSGLKHLVTLKELAELSLSGTKVDPTSLQALSGLQSLRDLFVWQTGVTGESVAALRKALPGINIETGFHDDGTMLQLNLPRIENASTVFRDSLELVLSHPIKNTRIRFTMDGSDPDSLHGLVYEGPVRLGSSVTRVKARAYKEGWIGSDIVSRYFLRSAFLPDSIVLGEPPAPEYQTTPPGIITDGETSNTDFRSGTWLGYRANQAEIILHFGKPVATSSVTLSTLSNTPSYIFPPALVEVWGALGDEPMELLGRWKPAQPDSLGGAGTGIEEYKYDLRKVTVLKIIARPVATLPGWHPAKGEKGWVFLDEILVN